MLKETRSMLWLVRH